MFALASEMTLVFVHSASYQALVVKASGLAGGKGVIVAEGREGACKAVDEITREFEDAGRVIVVEECLEGQEVSVCPSPLFSYFPK